MPMEGDIKYELESVGISNISQIFAKGDIECQLGRGKIKVCSSFAQPVFPSGRENKIFSHSFPLWGFCSTSFGNQVLLNQFSFRGSRREIRFRGSILQPDSQ